MVLDGLWVGEWHSNVNNIRISAGVIVFHEGRLFGGNDRVYAIGEYKVAGDRMEGAVRMTYYAGEPLGIFGLINVDQTEEVLVTGHCSGDEMKIEGILKADRMVRVHGTLHRKASL